MLQGDIDEIVKTMKSCKNPNDYRRLQSVHLGLLYPNMSAKEIGGITLHSESRVKAIHAKYRKEGLSGLFDARGGRYREHMPLADEVEFLAPFIEKGKTGALAVAGEIKRAYEAKIGKKVAESTIYRLLDRHGFRKIVPYKRHKKANVEEQEAFKKLFRHHHKRDKKRKARSPGTWGRNNPFRRHNDLVSR